MVVNKWVVGLLFFIVGCSVSPTGQGTALAPSEKGRLDVHFCQVENCSSFLLALIEQSQDSIECAFFDLDLKEIMKALGEKSLSIEVKLVIDNENALPNLKGGGVKYDTSSQYSHNKFCIFDNKKVFTGSFNPTVRDNTKNDNNIVIIESQYILQNYQDEFEELWNGAFGDGAEVQFPIVYLNGNHIENYFCPEDKCSERVIEVIKSARESIYFMTFSFTHDAIADAILFKDVEIRGIFEKVGAGSEYSQFGRFKGFGLDVVKDANPANMHHKVFIVDKKIVITGSFNPSSNADRDNDENILIIYNESIAAEYLKEFDRVYGMTQNLLK